MTIFIDYVHSLVFGGLKKPALASAFLLDNAGLSTKMNYAREFSLP
jgi:hypothetical protein